MPAPVGLGARPVADLVPSETGGAQGLVGHLILGGLVVVLRCRHLAAPHLSAQFGAFLDDESVGRDVIGLEVNGGVQACPPVRQRLPRRSVDQVNTHLETGGLCGLDRPGYVDRVMGAFQRRQYLRHG